MDIRKVNVNGIEIAYEEMGEGIPLMLVMGLGAQLVAWPDGFCEELVERGFRVIRFDNRDVGESTWMTDAGVPNVRDALKRRLAGRTVTAPYTLSDMAKDTVGLMDALEIDQAHFAGVSMGGMISQTIAIEHPERMLSLTSIMSTTGCRRHMVSHPKAAAALFSKPKTSAEEHVVENVVEFFSTMAGDLPVDQTELIRISKLAYSRGYNPAGPARQLAAVFASGSRKKALKKVKVPSQVLHGAQDPLILPAAGKATAKALGAPYHELEGMGHNLPRDHWPTISELIRNLA